MKYYILDKYIIEVYFEEFILTWFLIIFITQKYKNKFFFSYVLDFCCMTSFESNLKEKRILLTNLK